MDGHSRSTEQSRSAFVLREGWDLPITFRAHPRPAAVTSRTIITVFHIERGTGENHGFSGTADNWHIASAPRSCVFARFTRTCSSRSMMW
ncbi:hypothetical protein AX14_000309 [Amanita brunnescens Koide BX004]|nr:hypothetical protein AX14_000309 [Amanita brunnescens Koide BX004]